MPFLALAFFLSLGMLILAVLGYALWIMLPRIRKKRAGAHPLDANFEAEITPPPVQKRVDAGTRGKSSIRPTRHNKRQRRRQLPEHAVPEHSHVSATPTQRQYGMRPQNVQPQGMRPQGMRPQGMRPQGMRSEGPKSAANMPIKPAIKRTRAEKRHLKAVRSPEREAS